MGSNYIETAEAVSICYNKSSENILYMPAGHCWIFIRNKKPVYTEISYRLVLKEIDLIHSAPEVLAEELSV